MAEELVPLYGPNRISGDITSPTTLFTVPPRQTYILRSLSGVLSASGSQAGGFTPTVLIGKTNLNLANRVAALPITANGGAPNTGVTNTSIPFTEGEVCVAAVDGLMPPIAWGTGNATFNVSSIDSVDFTTDILDAATPGTTNPINFMLPCNYWGIEVNTKAASPDAISSFTAPAADQYSKMRDGPAVVSSVTSSTIRISLVGGNVVGDNYYPSGGHTINFGGATQTGFFCQGLYFQNGAYVSGLQSTSNIIRGIASASGTTATTQTITQAVGTDTFQLVVAYTTGIQSSYTMAAAAREVWDVNTAGAPAATCAAYLIDPAVANPAPVLAVAGTDFCAVSYEIYKGGAPVNLTVSGVKIFG